MHESGMGNMVLGDKNFAKGYVKKSRACTSAEVRHGLAIWLW